MWSDTLSGASMNSKQRKDFSGISLTSNSSDLPTVLFADDQEPILDTLQAAFAPSFNIITTIDGGQCMALASQYNPDLIVLDVDMGKYNGIELCKILKSTVWLKHIPIVLYTSYSNNVITEYAQAAGAVKVISKSVSLKILLQQLIECCEHQ